MITIEPYQHTEGEYQRLSEWWRGHGAQCPARGCLPRLGVWAMQDAEPVANVFLYQDNSVGVAFMNWLVARPDVNSVVLKAAIESMVDFIREECEDLGYGVVFSCVKDDGLAAVIGRCGFSRVEKVNLMVLNN